MSSFILWHAVVKIILFARPKHNYEIAPETDI